MHLRRLTRIGILSGIAIVLMQFQVSILPAFPQFKYELSDIPVLVSAFTLGPLSGVVVAFIKDFLFYLLRGDVSVLLNFIATGTFAYLAGYIYHHYRPVLEEQAKSKGTYQQTSPRYGKIAASLGLVLGTVAMVIMMVIIDSIVLPYVLNLKGKALQNFIVYGVIPFNLLKGTISSVLTFVIYKRIANLVKSNL